jgi:hypothetical protein
MKSFLKIINIFVFTGALIVNYSCFADERKAKCANIENKDSNFDFNKLSLGNFNLINLGKLEARIYNQSKEKIYLSSITVTIKDCSWRRGCMLLAEDTFFSDEDIIVPPSQARDFEVISKEKRLSEIKQSDNIAVTTSIGASLFPKRELIDCIRLHLGF